MMGSRLMFLLILTVPVYSENCTEGTCEDVITLPLLDNLRATLKADVDVSGMNKHLTAYIQQEMQKEVETAMKNVMKSIIDHGLKEANDTIISTIKEIFEGTRVTYIRWGRKTCPVGVHMIYTGQAGGNYYNHKGGGSNYLCLPHDPENGENINLTVIATFMVQSIK